jgi:hypothetical protein
MGDYSPTYVAKEQLTYSTKRGIESYVFDLRMSKVYNYNFDFDLMKKFEPTVNLPKRIQTGRIKEEEYLWFNDELMCDAQLGPIIFSKVGLDEIFPNGKFISNEKNETFSKKILKKNDWVYKYAQKKFLLIFRPDYSYLSDDIQYLYGFHVHHLRESNNDMNRWF